MRNQGGPTLLVHCKQVSLDLNIIGKNELGRDDALCQKTKCIRSPRIEKKYLPKDALARELQRIKQSENFGCKKIPP